MTLQQAPHRRRAALHTAGTHAAIALEAQGAPEWVCRWGMVAAQ